MAETCKDFEQATKKRKARRSNFVPFFSTFFNLAYSDIRMQKMHYGWQFRRPPWNQLNVLHERSCKVREGSSREADLRSSKDEAQLFCKLLGAPYLAALRN